MTETNLLKQMRHEIIDKEIFNRAKEYAFDYAEKSLERNVYPTEAAIEKLKVFDEQLPDNPGESKKILDLLHKFGSPATVSQIGGRYFGLVNGGVIHMNLSEGRLFVITFYLLNKHIATPTPA